MAANSSPSTVLDPPPPPPLPSPPARTARITPPPPKPPVDPRLRQRWFSRHPRIAAAIVVASIGAALAISTEPIFAVVFLFAIVVPFEKLFPRHKGQPVRRPQVGTDIAHGLLAPLLTPVAVAVAVVIGIASLAWIPGLLLRPLVSMLPPVALPFVGLALFDLTIYWVHRWSHEVPFLWRFHAIHHSTENLDWVSGFRQHPLDGAILAPPFVLLLAAGFDAEYTGALVVVQILVGLFLHANVRFRLRPLHKIIITPEFHHWHHTNEPDAIHSNYSVFLPLWDLVFGTYHMPKDRRPSTYGVDEYIPRGVVGQLLHPMRGMENPVRFVAHPVKSMKRLARFVAELCRQIWRSTRRSTRKKPMEFTGTGDAAF